MLCHCNVKKHSRHNGRQRRFDFFRAFMPHVSLVKQSDENISVKHD
jgi:hypothetical protein